MSQVDKDRALYLKKKLNFTLIGKSLTWQNGPRATDDNVRSENAILEGDAYGALGRFERFFDDATNAAHCFYLGAFELGGFEL